MVSVSSVSQSHDCRFREANKKHVEFAGRRNLGEIAKLYIKMEAKQEEIA